MSQPVEYTVDCPTCGAKPGRFCVTKNRTVALRAHVARVRSARGGAQ